MSEIYARICSSLLQTVVANCTNSQYCLNCIARSCLKQAIIYFAFVFYATQRARGIIDGFQLYRLALQNYGRCWQTSKAFSFKEVTACGIILCRRISLTILCRRISLTSLGCIIFVTPACVKLQKCVFRNSRTVLVRKHTWTNSRRI